MPYRTKVNSQSGFMSVEAIATTLFYLIMVAVVAAIAAQVITGGKIASTLNSIGALRVNVQYVGANLSNYSSVDSTSTGTFNPHEYVSSISTDGGTPPVYKLPTSHLISVFPAQAGDFSPDEMFVATPTAEATANNALFTMQIIGLSSSDCRKVAYYALGGGYGLTTTTATTAEITAGGGTAITAGTVEATCGTNTKVSLHLTSK